ncbi:O-antigen ligase [Vibrio alginolyticus]|uniref:O-antigen polymerase n=1 Tax=Vibrio alginolyticus TaxID=663 RepID=UPI00215BFAC0|nr:O-antigen polymerase [Vibrio alginolyticus]EJV5743200.1 oligosaccharide repeat unit polymerase [Vibrio alginolyticus]MCR9455411.1 oligosaccharide repeat unit polymerase [Vibrio alginolyticus]WDG13700.1 O-antigen ligase [Vibrio alginolyticus]
MMISLLFITNLIIFLFFVKYLNLASTKHVSMPGVYYCLSFLPILSMISPDIHEKISGRSGIDEYLIAITLHSIFIALGVLMSYFLFNAGKVPDRNYSRCLNTKENLSKLDFFILFVAISSFFHQILTLGNIPFLMIFLDVSVSDLTMAREGGYKLHGGYAVYIWHFSRMVFVPYLVCTSFVMYLQSKSSKNMIIFFLILIFGVFNNALSGAKAPVAMLFMCMFFIFIGVRRNINLKYIFLATLFIFIFPFLVEYSFSEEGLLDTLDKFSQKVINRFSYETFDRTLSYFDVFPHYMKYLGGRTNSLFTLFSQQEYFNVQNYIFIYRLDGILAEHLLYGSANAHFIGYMNADFGLIGVAISCLSIGIIIGFMDVYASTRLSSAKTISLYMVIAFIYWKLMGSQPTSVLFSHGAVLAFLLLVFQKRKINNY